MLLVLTCQSRNIRDIGIKFIFNQLTWLSVFFLLAGCSTPPVSSDVSIELTLTPVPTTDTVLGKEQIKVVTTRDADYPLLAIFPGGETLVVKGSHSQTDDKFSVESVVFMRPDDSSLIVYFIDGIPIRAFTENNWIELFDIQIDTTNITIVSKNENFVTLYNVPFEQSEIRFETVQESDVIGLIEFATSALRVFSCAASSVIDDGWADILDTSCALSTSSDYAIVLEGESGSIKCGVVTADGNLKPVSECVTQIITSAKNFEAVIPEHEMVTATESPTLSDSPVATPWLIDGSTIYEGNSISCTCQNCVCDSNPFFRVILTIDESGNVEGVLQKYTELFPEMPLTGTVDKITGSVKSEQILAYLEFEGSLSDEGNVISAILTAVFQESGASGVRELILYRMDQ